MRTPGSRAPPASATSGSSRDSGARCRRRGASACRSRRSCVPDLNDAVAAVVDAAMHVFRIPPLDRTGVYALEGLAPLQTVWERVARRRAVAAFRRARARCPAYARFLREQGFQGNVSMHDFGRVPATTKQNYVKVYSLEERCFGGAIP